MKMSDKRDRVDGYENLPLFAQYYTNVVNAIKNTHDDNEVLNEIVKCENDIERMKFLFKFDKIINIEDNALDIQRKYVGKDAKIANDLKACGNEAFKYKKWNEALKFYNKSYIALKGNEVKEKAIILANRSAALYHLDSFDAALKDTGSAMNYGYPKELLYKLYERQARCYLAKKEYSNAISCFQKYAKWTEEAKNLTKEAISKMNLHAMTMINMLEKNTQTKQQGGNQYVEKVDTGIGRLNLNFINENISFDENVTEGRFAKAAADIDVAEEILVENAFVAVLFPKFFQSHCDYCFKRTVTPVACANCADVIYCSEKCYKNSLNSYHKFECGIVHSIFKSGTSINCHMALRVIAAQTKDNLIKISNDLDRKYTTEEIQKFSTHDYRRISHMVRHDTSRTFSNYFQHALMARYLYKCLKEGGYFDDNIITTTKSDAEVSIIGASANDIDNDYEKLIIASIILRTLFILQFNTHEVFELRKFTDGGEKTYSIGGALYSTLAMFNHSCDPDVVRYFSGTTVHVFTINFISAGMPICENYGPIYTQECCDKRREELKQLYCFDCNCRACSNDWPTFDKLSSTIIPFRCESSKCRALINMTAALCNNCLIKCDTCGESINIFNGLKVVKDIEIMIKAARNYYEAGEYKNALSRFTNILKIFHEVLVPPFADYCQCQQYLKDCIVQYGNTYEVNSNE